MESKNRKLSSMWCHISDLHPSKMKHIEAIKLSFVRVYELPQYQNTNEINSLECIAHDSKGDRIAITIPRSIMNKWRSLIKEGAIYGIRNFLLIQNSGLKIVKHNYKIKFKSDTEMRRRGDDEFPKQLFEFKQFKDIKQMDVGEGFFDIIGILLNEPHMKTYLSRSGEEKKLVEVFLQDPQRERITCTLWDEYCEEFLKLLEENGQPVNVIILQFGKPYMYKDKMQMQSYFHISKISVNANIKEVEEFRQRFIAVTDLSTTIIGSQSEGSTSCLTNNPTNSIGELKTIDELFFVNEVGFYWIVGQVIEIDTDDGWYYISCKCCKTKLIKQEHAFYCDYCKVKHSSGSLRFRLVIDVSDETGGTRLVLWDKECVQIVGKGVEELIENINYMNELPDIIFKAFVGNKFLFKIAIKTHAENEYNGSYSVMEVNSDLTYITAFNHNTCMIEDLASESKLEENKVSLESIEEFIPVETPNPRSDTVMGDDDENEEDKHVKRSLADEFSSTKPLKKTKVFIKKEKK